MSKQYFYHLDNQLFYQPILLTNFIKNEEIYFNRSYAADRFGRNGTEASDC